MRSVYPLIFSLLALATPPAFASEQLDDIENALSLVQLRAEKRPKSSEAHAESKAGASAALSTPERDSLRSRCVFTAPVRGRSPGKVLERHKDVATVEECQQHCEETQQCRAVEFASADRTCSMLARMFDGHLEPAPEGMEVVVANKMVCGASALALGSNDGTNSGGGFHPDVVAMMEDVKSVAFSEVGAGSIQPKGRHRQELQARGDGQVSHFSGAEDSFITLKDLPDTFGGPSGFSVAFTSTWEALGRDTHLIDFGREHGKDSIVVGNVKDTSGLVFYVEKDGAKAVVQVKHAIKLNKTSRFLCTVEGQGHMRVFRDGELIGENKEGHAPAAVARDLLYIGKPQGKGTMFTGQLSDLCIWNAGVAWEKAESCISNSSPKLMYAAHILPTTWSQNPALGN